MCGICGIFNFKNEYREDPEIVKAMLGEILHRGPDGAGYFVRGKIALGFSRLSLVDLEGGMQPISNEAGNIIMICNGEIYNYRELREILRGKGHSFKTGTDVEVVLHMYEEWGTAFLNRLNGQFAFAIYDARREILFCARDHAGIAPFFYTIAEGMFIFASEIKSLLKHPAVKKEVDLIAFDQLMTFPGVIAPRTMFRGVSSLENGSYLVVRTSGTLDIGQYWDLRYPKLGGEPYDTDESYYIEKLDQLLTVAVDRRLQADVPVGFYLSGGVDSSLIASKAKGLYSLAEMHSFSIDFAQKNISEAKYQKIAAQYIGTLHHEKQFFTENIADGLCKAVYHSEMPLKETYNTASLVLSKMVRQQGIKAVLTGEGADELFAGYVGYRFDQLRRPQTEQYRLETPEAEIRERLWGDPDFFYEKDYHSYTDIKRELYSEQINEIFDEIDCLKHPVINKERIENVDILHKRSYIDFKLRLPEHLLADHGDRMTYANSVEARYPFLDREVLEFVVQIPPALKLKDFEEKYILKKLAQGIVPDPIVKRPKFAFVAPGSPELLRLNNEYVTDMLSSTRIRYNGYFNPLFVEGLRDKYCKDGFKLNLPYENDFLIIVITFGIFLEKFGMPSLK